MLLLFVLASVLIAHTRCSNIDTDVETNIYTDVQSSSVFCESPKVNKASVKKVVCNFRNTAARLGNTSVFVETLAQQGGELHLEIRDCSKLLISTAFHTWRIVFSSLHLAIENVDQVIQEEMPSRFHIGRNLITPSEFINFSLKKSKMTTMSSPLFSDTKTLLVDIQECQIDTVSRDTFRNVYKLCKLSILNSNISRIENGTMPVAVPLASPPASANIIEFPLFIFNKTRIELLESGAIQLRIMEKEEYLNIVNSELIKVQKGAISISGTGHALIADSTFHQIENDAIMIHLKGSDSENSHKLIDSSTVTLMGLEFLSVINVTNLLLNFQVTNGKLFFTRMAFLFPGALSSIISLDNNVTIPHIWDHNHTAILERWTVTCSCQEIGTGLFASNHIRKRRDQSTNEFYDYEEAEPRVVATSTVPSTTPQKWRILNELKCQQDSLSFTDFHSLHCLQLSTTTTSTTEPIDLVNTATPDQSTTISTPEERQFIWYPIVAGICGLVTLAVITLVCIVRQKKKSYKIDKRKSKRPNNTKQVGVISEDPICGREDGEDESQI